MIALYVILGIIALLLFIAIVKTILFVPKNEQNIVTEEIKVDVNKAASDLSEMVKCKPSSLTPCQYFAVI